MEKRAFLEVAGNLTKDHVRVFGAGLTGRLLWKDYSGRHDLALLSSMGSGIPFALGLALALPHRLVSVFEGDGSVLMNLGGLSTVARYGSPNLLIIIMDNRSHETTGGQETATAYGADLAAVAEACGIRSVSRADAADELRAALLEPPDGHGPRVVVAYVKRDDELFAPRIDTPADSLLEQFQKSLAAEES